MFCQSRPLIFLLLILLPLQTFASIEMVPQHEAALARRPRPVLIHQQCSSGMFAVFSSVLGALEKYDTGKFSGIRLDFNNGFYLDPSYGLNWWNYYFEPVDKGSEGARNYYSTQADYMQFAERGFGMHRKRAFALIQKYVQVLPHIQAQVEWFYNERLQGHYVIGLHHRGTDKVIEFPLVAYEKNRDAILRHMNSLPEAVRSTIKIYVATDDASFIDYISTAFPHQVVYNDFVRSDDNAPLHYGNDQRYFSNYQKGEEALIDCLLLSRCHYLIRPMSSLSIISGYFNPNVPVEVLLGE